MKLNYIAYYMDYDGYGRFNSRLVWALQQVGVQVKPATMDAISMPAWMQEQEGLDWNALTISCLPPYYLQDVPGRHWLLSMVEGSVVPKDWVEKINGSQIERVLVPCQHNAEAFRDSGVLVPISVLHGGTDPGEFPLKQWNGESSPYTFLTLADRGYRKGWTEVWEAFYIAFGGKTGGCKDVRLVIKSRPKRTPTLIDWMSSANGRDERIVYQVSDPKGMYSVYEQADCLVLPSRSEGWGMPHREAAMMGLPVVTQRYSGLDDGNLSEWALALELGELKPIPKEDKLTLGEWMVADVGELAEKMHWCKTHQSEARQAGQNGARWLRANQTWGHTAAHLKEMIENAVSVEHTSLPV